jgi:hypothetical protein
MIKALEDPYYYLENFQRVLAWIAERYSDLLTCEEGEFIERFSDLPKASRALLVRMVMRKGDLFRASKLRYAEIGDAEQAASALVTAGWIDDQPLLTLGQLFGLLKKTEIAKVFGTHLQNVGARKAEQLQALSAEFPEARRFSAWYPDGGECVYQVLISDLCERFRLMFFGNLHQDWSEFVLADLGIFKYEKVEFSASSRGFRTRCDVDDYLHLYRCRERFEQGEPLPDILEDIPAVVYENDWLEGRRAKLLFRIAQHCEQNDDLQSALRIYSGCGYPGSRIRRIRVLERCEQFEAAFELAESAGRAPESDAETQLLARIMPRLQRKLGRPKMPPSRAAPLMRIDLTLPPPETPLSVETLVRNHLEQAQAPAHAPAYYVENTLINSLFGLLCWNAVFATVPGAFFHPFHTGPADLLSADFYRRREREFADCLSQLGSEQYKHTIRHNYREKAGIQSPFVFWGILSEELLELALDCIPASHLNKWFERMLRDIQSNRAGLPDLIQFWPQEQRYRMIEVKGPGDRLQDNQIRWLEYCTAHDMPVSVCYVQWMEGVA